MIILVLNNKVNVESIKNSIEAFNWEVIFINKGIHKQVSIFNETLMNILSNFTPNMLHLMIGTPPGRMVMIILSFKEAANLGSQVVSNRKQEYYSNIALKLNNPKTSAKTYWSILKIFYNDKKIPFIPPLLIKNKLVSNFKAKLNHFNIFLLPTVPQQIITVSTRKSNLCNR